MIGFAILEGNIIIEKWIKMIMVCFFFKTNKDFVLSLKLQKYFIQNDIFMFGLWSNTVILRKLRFIVQPESR